MVVTFASPSSTRTSRRPSCKVVDDLLRGKLGYHGVIVTDDLGMGAITGVRKACRTPLLQRRGRVKTFWA